jgi:DNA topoisomerase-1
MLEFARALPAIRRRVEADLGLPDLPREKVLAAVVRLMEDTLARVGNPEYASQNNTFGLTTLRNRHVRIARGRIELDFRGKHGIRHVSLVSDRKLARVVKNCRDLPGSELFQYVDDDGQRRSIDSGDVNDYLREISGREVSAKDFRTWAATNLAVLALSVLEEDKPTKKATLNVIKQVAEQLGNTPAVCRKCYIHPAVFEGYLAGTLRISATVEDLDEFPAGVWSLERQVMRFLKTFTATSAAQPSKGKRSRQSASRQGRIPRKAIRHRSASVSSAR